MLILPDANGLGVDLYQLGQRILQAAGNGYSGTQIDIKFGKFFGGQLAGGVDRCAGFVDHHIADSAAHPADQFNCHLFRLPAGSAVADGQMLHAVLVHQSGEFGNTLLFLACAVGGVDHGGIQYLAGAVHHSHFAAHAVTGVQSHSDLALDGGLHQQRLEIEGEVMDGTLVCGFGKMIADLALQRGLDQAVVCVVGGSPDKGYSGAAGNGGAAHGDMGGFAVQFHADLQNAFPLTAVDGQDLVSLRAANGGLEVVVQAIDGVLRFFLGSFGYQHTPAQKQITQLFAYIGIVGDHLCDDVVGPLQSSIHAVHTLFGINIVFSGNFGVYSGAGGEQQLGQRLQSLFLCDGSSGAALLFIGAVQILYLGQGDGSVDGGG